jgi:hypothetical protein
MMLYTVAVRDSKHEGYRILGHVRIPSSTSKHTREHIMKVAERRGVTVTEIDEPVTTGDEFSFDDQIGRWLR